MNSPNNKSEIIDEDIINYCPDSDQQSLKKKEYPQEIAKILYYLNDYNTNLISSIKRDYPSEYKYINQYSSEYYCINANWMNYFLEFYNYKKIKTLIRSNKIKSGEDLYINIKKEEIPLNFGYNDSHLENIKKEKFEPKIESISNYKIGRAHV